MSSLFTCYVLCVMSHQLLPFCFLQNTTTVRHLKGQDDTKGVMIAALIGIEELAKRLRFIGMKLEQRLETMKGRF